MLKGGGNCPGLNAAIRAVVKSAAKRGWETRGKETRVCVLGHLQRGGAPTTCDRLLCTRFGASAVRLIGEERYGYMVALRPPDTDAIPIKEAIGRLRTVPPDGDIIRTGRALGIGFGD
jgi:6-phosphofructokinase 1